MSRGGWRSISGLTGRTWSTYLPRHSHKLQFFQRWVSEFRLHAFLAQCGFPNLYQHGILSLEGHFICNQETGSRYGTWNISRGVWQSVDRNKTYVWLFFSDADRLRIDFFFEVLRCMCDDITDSAGKEMCRHQLHSWEQPGPLKSGICWILININSIYLHSSNLGILVFDWLNSKNAEKLRFVLKWEELLNQVWLVSTAGNLLDTRQKSQKSMEWMWWRSVNAPHTEPWNTT